MVLIGTDGSGMFNHWDTLRTVSYQIQLRGAKQWHVCDPQQSQFTSDGWDMMLDPDYEAHPQMLNAHCYLDIVRTGEAIAYPANYWHQTLNIADGPDDYCVGITDTVVTPANFRMVEGPLQDYCKRPVAPLINPSAELCALFPGIFQWWNREFAGRVDNSEWHQQGFRADSAAERTSPHNEL
jgi:hypothetical protein